MKNPNKSITVKLQDGSSKIVLFSGNTSINKASEGSKEEECFNSKTFCFAGSSHLLHFLLLHSPWD